MKCIQLLATRAASVRRVVALSAACEDGTREPRDRVSAVAYTVGLTLASRASTVSSSFSHSQRLLSALWISMSERAAIGTPTRAARGRRGQHV